MANFITICIILTILSIAMKPGIVIHAQQQVPCYFFFGEALFDKGNNNNLNTVIKANYLPYGIDYIYGITGRFTNQANIPDFLAQRMGVFSFSPPICDCRGRAPIQLCEGDRISLNKQLMNHQKTINQITTIPGNQRATNNLLNQCLYTVTIGSEDYGTNYYFRPRVTLNSILYTPETYAQKLIDQYSLQLTTLHTLEARKVAVFGLLPIGCDPSSLSHYPTNASGCVDFLNNAAQIFNTKLISLINNLNTNLHYINLYGMLYANLSSIGVRVQNAPFCEVNSVGLCARNGGVCSNSTDEYAYFDNYHPTGVVFNYTASREYNAQIPSDAIPIDIATLIRK